MKKASKILAVLCVLAMVLSAVACSGTTTPGTSTTAPAATAAATTAAAAATTAPAAPVEEEKPVITITTMYFSAESPNNDAVNQALTDITGYTAEINWVPTNGYEDKINTMLASDTLSMINIFSNVKSSAYLSAVRDGLFWQLDDYIADYPNLVQMGEARYNNIKVDGKVFGIPRGRDLVRQGFIYRSDWAEAAGFASAPTTTEDIDKLVRAYKANNSTYGLTGGAGTGYPEGVQYLAVYLGAPLNWGTDANGNLVNMWLTDEFQQSVDQFATWYKDGVLNKNFVEINAEDSKKLINTEEAGFVFIYADDIANRFADLYVKNPDAKLWYGLKANDRTFATAGFNGTMAISKTATKDEATLKHCLAFIDALGAPEWQTVITSGLEGVHYAVQDGVAVQTAEQNTTYSATAAQYGQVNCFGGVIMPSIPGKTIEAIEELKKERLLYVDSSIKDPTTPYVSETATTIGTTDLDPVRNDAINKYILGAISLDEYKAAQQKWLDLGGAKVTEELKAQIDANK